MCVIRLMNLGGLEMLLRMTAGMSISPPQPWCGYRQTGGRLQPLVTIRAWAGVPPTNSWTAPLLKDHTIVQKCHCNMHRHFCRSSSGLTSQHVVLRRTSVSRHDHVTRQRAAVFLLHQTALRNLQAVSRTVSSAARRCTPVFDQGAHSAPTSTTFIAFGLSCFCSDWVWLGCC